MKKTLCIEGLDCAACAAELEEELSKIKGISSVSVSFVMQKIALEYADEEALAKGYLSEERIAYYKAEVDKTEAELVEAKNSLLDKYFNGRFWGVPNSPYYLYVQLGSGSFQQPTSTLTFNYVKVGDTYCVFSDEFILG